MSLLPLLTLARVQVAQWRAPSPAPLEIMGPRSNTNRPRRAARCCPTGLAQGQRGKLASCGTHGAESKSKMQTRDSASLQQKMNPLQEENWRCPKFFTQSFVFWEISNSKLLYFHLNKDEDQHLDRRTRDAMIKVGVENQNQTPSACSVMTSGREETAGEGGPRFPSSMRAGQIWFMREALWKGSRCGAQRAPRHPRTVTRDTAKAQQL